MPMSFTFHNLHEVKVISILIKETSSVERTTSHVKFRVLGHLSSTFEMIHDSLS